MQCTLINHSSLLIRLGNNKDINFEELYIGHHLKIYRYPKHHYNSDIMKYLSMFGYKYQKSK